MTKISGDRDMGALRSQRHPGQSAFLTFEETGDLEGLAADSECEQSNVNIAESTQQLAEHT